MLLAHLLVKIVEILGIVEFDIGTAPKVFLYFGKNHQLSFDALFQAFQLLVQLKANV